MATYQPAPTYAEVLLVDEVTKKARFNPIWLKWFLDLTAALSESGAAGGAVSHESLDDLLGGAAADHYHFTSGEHTALVAGFTGTGALARQTAPTFLGDVTIGGKVKVGSATALVTSTVAMNNGAAAAAGTILNAPAAGNPTKWIPIDDNGTVRYVPAW